MSQKSLTSPTIRHTFRSDALEDGTESRYMLMAMTLIRTFAADGDVTMRQNPSLAQDTFGFGESSLDLIQMDDYLRENSA
jgi:hypothetical protein